MADAAAPFDWDTLGQYKLGGALPPGTPANVRTFWTARDNVHGALLALVRSAQHSLVLNMYGYDDDDLDQAIREKLDAEHVYVQMSLDRSQAGGVHEKAILAHWNPEDTTNSVAIGTAESGAISHLKMLIVDGVYVVHGSTNWSASGEGVSKAQDNELTLTNDPALAAEARTVLDINHRQMLAQMAKRAGEAQTTGNAVNVGVRTQS